MKNQGCSTSESQPDATKRNRRPPLKFYEERDILLMPVATKVLHRNRPGWIPMLDNVILFAYFEAVGRRGMKGRSQEGELAAGVGVLVMDAFRRDLVTVEDELDSIREVLEANGTPLAAVRVMEVAAWMATEPLGQYR